MDTPDLTAPVFHRMTMFAGEVRRMRVQIVRDGAPVTDLEDWEFTSAMTVNGELVAGYSFSVEVEGDGIVLWELDTLGLSPASEAVVDFVGTDLSGDAHVLAYISPLELLPTPTFPQP